MGDEGLPLPSDFERADMPVAVQQTCAAGAHPLGASYYTINGRAICQACREQFDKQQRANGSFGLALLLGTGAAAVGAAIYYAIEAVTGYELGLVAIVVGVIVGKAVRRGAGARPGRIYRLMALMLTYMAMTATYVPLVLKEGGMHSLLGACILAFILPGLMLAKLENLLGTVILGIGLYEAYKYSAPPRLAIEGPFSNAPVPAPAPAAAAQGALPSA